MTIELTYDGRAITAQVWRVRVGRAPLFLLDTNLEANRPENRDITDQLYGGDLKMRLKREILLGIGGYRALEALGIEPTVYHMNEGHSAFLGLEWVRRLRKDAVSHLAKRARWPRPGSSSLPTRRRRRGTTIFRRRCLIATWENTWASSESAAGSSSDWADRIRTTMRRNFA